MKSWNPITRVLNNPAGLAAFTLFAGVYIGLLAWFRLFDVYHVRFSTSGALILAYNFFRLLFVFYLFWMLYCAGNLLLRLVLRRRIDGQNVIDDIALKFFAGAGVWHVALLVLGCLWLYTPAVAIGITLPLVAVSFFDFWAVLGRALTAWRGRTRGDWSRGDLAARALAGIAVALALLLLVARGLYPGGGHDYFLHYFAHYRSVIDDGGLWPNQVWYQYYYSKGAGLYFLGFLLTDPLAPQLVSFCFVAVAGLVVWRFVGRFSAGSLWPWAGVAVFFGIYIYTPGNGPFRQDGGWGDFEKLHELNAALVIAIFWMGAAALDRDNRLAASWIVGAVSAVAAAVVINPPIAFYLGLTFCLVAVWFYVRGRRRQSSTSLAVAGASGVVLCAIFALNYFASGLIDDQGILYFWRFADVEKLYRWGALAQVILLDRDRTLLLRPDHAVSFVWLLRQCLRWDLLYPLLIGGTFVLLVTLVVRPSFRKRAVAGLGNADVPVLAAALLAFPAFAYAGRDQYLSLFRFSSFMVPVLIVSGFALWAASFDQLVPDPKRSVWSAIVSMLVVAVVGAAVASSFGNDRVREHLANTWRFAIGRFSIDRAYTT